VVDYLLELVSVTNEEVSRDVLFADDEPPAPPAAAEKKPRKKAKAEPAED
jgi:hypothetical protein